MDRTEARLRKLFTALPAPGYDLGTLSERGMYRLEAVSPARILRMLPYLKYRNANGAHIYMRPTGESAYTLLDDLTPATLARLATEGYCPAAVVETSPGSFQHGYATHSGFPRSSAPLLQRRLPNSSAQTPALPTGEGSDERPGSPTESPSTATPRASTLSHVSSITPASRSQQQSNSACSLTPFRRKPSRNVPPPVSALLPDQRAHPVGSHSHASARRPATPAGQPPQIWLSA